MKIADSVFLFFELLSIVTIISFTISASIFIMGKEDVATKTIKANYLFIPLKIGLSSAMVSLYYYWPALNTDNDSLNEFVAFSMILVVTFIIEYLVIVAINLIKKPIEKIKSVDRAAYLGWSPLLVSLQTGEILLNVLDFITVMVLIFIKLKIKI